MKEITLRVPDEDYGFLLKLLKKLNLATIIPEDEGDSDLEIIENLKSSFAELEQIKLGNKKTSLAKDFINEL